QRPLERPRVQPRLRPVRRVGGQDVDPPALRVLVPDSLALPRQAPAVAGRQGGREAALVQVVQPQPARLRFFLAPLDTVAAGATVAGSCLWPTVWAVRR